MPITSGRLLIIDDDREIVDFLQMALSQQGHETVGFINPQEALMALREQTFDVLLCDLMMPEMNGLEVLRAAVEIDPHLVTLILSGQGSIEIAVEAMQSGAFDFIVKPVDPEVLRPVITRALVFRHLRLENAHLHETIALHELTRSISFMPDAESILGKVADAVLQLCRADETSIMLPTMDCEELYVAVARGTRRKNITGKRVAMGQGIAGWVAKHHDSLTLWGKVTDERFSPVYARDDIQSSIAMPLISSGKLIGIINVNSTNPHHRFTTTIVKSLSLLAVAVAPVLENAWLYIKLQTAEAKYRSIFENAVDGVYQCSVEGGFLTANPALARICGYDSADDLIKNITNIKEQLYVDSRDREAKLKLLQDDMVQGFETRWRRKDGEVIWVSLSSRAVRDENGKISSLEGIVKDISQRKEAELALRSSENRFRTFMDNTPALVFIKDEEGRYIYLNRAVEERVNKPCSELLGQTNFDRFPYETAQMLQEHDMQVLSSGKAEQFEESVPGPDGGWHHEIVMKFPLPDGERESVLLAGVAIDVTKQKQTEVELRASEARFRRVFESEMIGILFWNSVGTLIDANDAFLKMVGYTHNDLAQGLVDWKTITPSEFLGGDVQKFEEMRATGACKPYEKEYIRKDGSRIAVMVAAALFEQSPFTGVSFVLDISDRKQAQEELRYAHSELEKRVERRTEQLAKANEELQEAKEAADTANVAKSEFLSRMSHELRTPLNAILGFGQILSMQELDPLEQESIDHILKAGDHLLKLINEVLDIARVEAGRMDVSVEAVEVKNIVRESLALIRPLAEGNHITLELQESESLTGQDHILADHQRLKQALLNLLSNGIKYNRENGVVTISYRLIAGQKLRLDVSDTGPGIAAENLEKLFTPFERLDAGKTTIEGTGLGLTLSRRMIEAMGGSLGVESVMGKGSTFYIELPLTPCPVSELGARENNIPANAIKLHKTFKVLSIEDNASNHRLIEAILSYRPGAELLGAIQGSMGLDLARRHHPDVILLDLHLPDMHGSEVLRQLRESVETATIPIIVISADATPNQIERLLDGGANAYITKPLKVKEFLHVLDEMVKGIK